ncbi:MAG: VWA domain-containing protein [Planctomycetaceae bacterium]
MIAAATFLEPETLALLPLAALVWLFFWALDRAGRRRLLLAVGPRADKLAPGTSRGRRRRALFAGGLLLALLAFAQPLWGAGAHPLEPRGADLVVCLDVSRSMLARDLAPNRLERAREEIRALATRAAGDRIALVLFAGQARLAVPLTRDLASFADLAARADPLDIPRGGTDLGAALAAALGALESGTGEHAAILLLTDGEDLEGRGLRGAEACRERGVPVHGVGLGSARGAKIPLEGEGGYVKDRSGAEVISVMDPASLQRIARATGGGFADASGGPGTLRELYERTILPRAREAFRSRERREQPNRYQWPLLAALLAFALEPLLAARRRA